MITITLKNRIKIVKEMHNAIIALGDDDLYFRWICIVPDEASDEDFEYIAEEDALYNAAISMFIKIVTKK